MPSLSHRASVNEGFREQATTVENALFAQTTFAGHVVLPELPGAEQA